MGDITHLLGDLEPFKWRNYWIVNSSDVSVCKFQIEDTYIGIQSGESNPIRASFGQVFDIVAKILSEHL